jgi:16S rRNA (cytidine1402-2'-O)-methyltransferase
VVPIPGPSAAIAALAGSGFPSDSFFFAGFLPARGAPRKRRLEELADIPSTLIFYEAPHRLLNSLEDMIAVLGTRRACIARELTKIYEEFLQGTLVELLDNLRARPKIQGEITLIIERGHEALAAIEWPVSIKQHLEVEMQKSGLSRNEALKTIAKQRGLSRKEAYNLLNEELNK